MSAKRSMSRALTREESYQDGHLTRTAFISIAILTFITFVGNFTQLQLSAALPTIVSDFGISVTTGQWLTSIFQLVMGVMVPLTAYLTRRFSTREIVLVSMVVFTIGSLFAWLGPTFLMVLIGRLLEAVGTGVMWPVLQITVFSIYPLSRRGFAMGTVGMAMSVAPAIGPTLGGVQTDLNGWRSIFLTLTIIGVISLLLAYFGLHNFGENDKTAKADFFSVGLSIFGFGGLMFGFTNIESYSFVNPMVWLPMVIGVVGIIWFVLRQIHGARRQIENPEAQPPLLNLSVLKNRSFTVGTIPMLLVISFVVFMFIHMIPGDPARLVAGQDATKEDVAVVREQLGLDEPLLVQYGKYMKGLFTGDLGSSIKNGKTVVETIAPRLKPTIMLTFSSMIWAAIIGIAIGIIAAVFHGRILDYVGMIIAIAGISVPSFWLGLELIQLFSVSLGWLPTSGLETWKSYILPSLTMGAGIMAVLARFSRSSMLETMREDYVRTARAKGLSESLVVMRHAFKNSLIEIVTVAGLQIGGLLSGSVMAETVFSIPGLGRLLVDSIQMRDYKVVQALLLFFATEYILINLIVDVLYGVINPRVRYE